jgi:glucose-6-phosphate dehydrogenase assembly protein OpcA
MNESERARAGEDLPVDLAQIERSLADLWRSEGSGSKDAVTKAALWNVLAHTDNDHDRMRAAQTLGLVSVSVPQRSIVIRAQPAAPAELSSWISANCHLIGGEKQVCSEEIAIVAGGRRVDDVPSLVNALLVPDMPVVAWWIGDLPTEARSYVTRLLEPADRLIVDSSQFDGAAELDLLARVGSETQTIPADLNWIRLEEWRLATASMFDATPMRKRLRDIREVRVVSRRSSEGGFGERIDAALYAGWLVTSLNVDLPVHFVASDRTGPGAILSVSIEFGSGGRVVVERLEAQRAIVARGEGIDGAWPTVTHCRTREVVDLLVGQLSRRDEDWLFPRVLPAAARLAQTF